MGLTNTLHVGTSSQLVDIFTKGLSMTLSDLVSGRLGLFDLYVPTGEAVRVDYVPFYGHF